MNDTTSQPCPNSFPAIEQEYEQLIEEIKKKNPYSEYDGENQGFTDSEVEFPCEYWKTRTPHWQK